MTKEIVLVLTNSKDGIHSDRVIEELSRKRQPFFRFDVDTLGTGETSVRFFGDSQGMSFQLSNGETTVEASSVRSVWYRRPTLLESPISDQAQREHAEREIMAFLEGSWSCLRDSFWMSPFKNIREAHYKVLQLQVCRQIALPFPETLISNDPEQVRAFYRQHRSIVFKTICHNPIFATDAIFHIPTTLITQDHLSKLELIRRSPGFFQRCIDKVCEVRVTCVGRTFFSVRIAPQEEPGEVDWRRSVIGCENASYEIVDLPTRIRQKCQAMMTIFGLSYGAFDFIVDKAGNWYFLELNPIGQWYWLEERTGLAISEEIAKTLVRQ